MGFGQVCSALLLIVTGIGLTAQEGVNGPKPQEPATPAPPPSIINVPPPPLDPDAFRVSSDVELVLMDVSVKGPEGGFISGLQRSNFKVFEDRVEQKITTFGAQDTPVTMGLVVDNSGSVRPKKTEIVTAALALVTNSNPNDEVFVVNFNDRVRKGLPEDTPFSADKNVLRQALLTNPAQGRTALYDGLSVAIDHLAKGRLDKKTLILISDGGDNSSDLTRDQLIRLAEESQATIYTIGIYNKDDKDKNPGFLKELARITGGEFFEPQSTQHLVGIADKIAHDIRNRYTLGFVPQKRTHDGRMRRLQVVATSPEGKKYEVRTRTHYRSPGSEVTRTRDGHK